MANSPARQPSKQATPLVSVIILNHNGLRFLKDCFDSLRSCSYPNMEIILVDNLSSDDSVRFTRQNYPEIKIVESGGNEGFSWGYNLSFAHASGSYYVLLNNDVTVEPGWLEPLVEAAEADPQIGALQPKIRSMVNRDCFEYAGASGGYIDKYGYPFLRGRVFYTIEKDDGQYDDETDVFWTSGAAMFVRAGALQKSGVLDEDFVFHMEEIDLCWRLQLCGYRLKVIPASVIYHFAGGTLQQGSFKKLYWNHRNNIFMMIKNMETGTLLRRLPFRFMLDMINIVFSALKTDISHSSAIIQAYLWLLAHIGLLMKKRREVQQMRQLGDQQIERNVLQKSIILDYFLRGRRTFAEIAGTQFPLSDNNTVNQIGRKISAPGTVSSG